MYDDIYQIKKPKILVIDDSESLLFLLKNVLVPHFDVVTTDRAKKALNILNDTFDTIIIDLMMPEMSGIDFIKKIKNNKDYQFIPVIVLTAKHNTEDDIANLFDLGVNDYISKPFFSAELIARVKTHSRIKILTDGLVQANRKLLFSATHDDLTKVYNRSAIFDFLENEILRQKRNKSKLSLMMFDIDYFKDINDKYGHLVGDHILLEVVNIVKQLVREIDLIGRYGGDEFLIIFPETSLTKAKQIADRIINRFKNNKIAYNNNLINVGVSIGLTLYDSNETVDNFIERVDRALYEAKESGRFCVKYI